MFDVEANTCPPHMPGLKRPLGVAGGMGSLATANFLRLWPKKVGWTQIKTTCYLSFPNTSDRSHAISIGCSAQILERAKWFERAGCGAIAIPCNTAHFWSSDIADALTVNFISMIEVTRDFIRRENGSDLGNLPIAVA